MGDEKTAVGFRPSAVGRRSSFHVFRFTFHVGKEYRFGAYGLQPKTGFCLFRLQSVNFKL